MPHRLLLIEASALSAEADIGGMLASAKGFLCERATWDSFQPDSLRQSSAHLVVSVAVPLLQPALGFFQWLQTHPISTPMLAVLPAETAEDILRTVSEVADDFILCPIHREELHHRLRRILGRNTNEVEAVHDRLAHTMGLGQLVGADPAFVRSIETIPLIAKSGTPVLITGQTGTGKELCARLQSIGVTTIDYHVTSHYHDDHIGCSEDVLKAFPFQEAAFDRGGKYSSGTFKAYKKSVGTLRKAVGAAAGSAFSHGTS